jgi:hypothetical protein
MKERVRYHKNRRKSQLELDLTGASQRSRKSRSAKART